MRQILTFKQQMFAAALLGPARGNQTRAARMAGYKGSDPQLAVQGSVNMKNPQIQQMITERLGPLLEPSLKAYAEGLVATKRRAFLTKAGAIVYTDPEPDHRIRTATANQVLDRYQRTSGHTAGSGADVVPAHEGGAEPQNEVVDDAKTEGCAESEKVLAVMDPTDRMLIRAAAEIDQQIAQLDGETSENPNQDERSKG